MCSVNTPSHLINDIHIEKRPFLGGRNAWLVSNVDISLFKTTTLKRWRQVIGFIFHLILRSYDYNRHVEG